MTFDQYQDEAATTAIYGNPIYPILGLAEEAGEVAGKFAKAMRDGYVVDRMVIMQELGDVLWMVSEIARNNHIPLDELAHHNLEKLRSRQDRGTITGAGDNR